MKKIFGLSLLSLLLITKAQAQVNLQTGSAVFSLPLFNWQDNESRLNSIIALEYNSGNGLKVNETASDEGQGWDLIAGGVITRLQVGEPDDQKAYYKGSQDGSKEQDADITKYPAGYLYAPVSASLGCPNALTKYPLYRAENTLYKEHNITAEDREQDYFTFQFNGKSGLFVLNNSTNTGIPLGDTKIKISFQTDTTLATGNYNGIRTTITSFTIQDVDGLIYKFTEHSMTKTLQQRFCNANATRPLTQPTFKDSRVYYQAGFVNDSLLINPWVINGWYLSEIDDPLTGRKVVFNYIMRNVDNNADISIATNQSDKSYVLLTRKTSMATQPEISSIEYPDGHNVIFNYSPAERADMPGEYPLASIDITYDGRYLSEYELKTSYFILNRYGTPVYSYEQSAARLCLRSVTKVGVDLKAASPPYLFDYYMGNADSADDFVPPPYFYAKDIWGYFNGNNSEAWNGAAISLNTPITRLNYNELRGLCFFHENTSGVVLNPKSDYAENGLLRQVIYPTGGTLTYQYSQNYGVLPLGSADTMVGGVHVSETLSTDGGYAQGCNNPVVIHYNYDLNGPGSPSSLWGLERPVNTISENIVYIPEDEKWNFWKGSCYYKYEFPGILSQDQSIDFSFLQKALQSLSPVLGVSSYLGDVMDVATVAGGSTGVLSIGAVVVDAIGVFANLYLTCWKSMSQNFTTTIYYNTNLNDVSPLPEQFKRVEVVQGNGEGGKTVQTFTSSDDYPLWVGAGDDSAMSAGQRFAPWAYGLPKLTAIYDSSGNIVKETQNIYDTAYAREEVQGSCSSQQPMASHAIHPQAAAAGCPVQSCHCEVLQSHSQRYPYWSTPSKTPGDGGYDDSLTYHTATVSGIMNVNIYPLYTGRVQLDTTYERTYHPGDTTKYVQTMEAYLYNFTNNYEVARITTRQSNGDVNYKNFTYSSDYYTGGSGVLATLVNNNLISVPVETSTSVMKAGQSTLQYLGEHVTEYTQLANGNIVPSDVLEQRLSEPSSTTSLYGGPGSNTSNYHTVRTYTYDDSGDVIGVQDEGLHVITNTYGYNRKYIIATVINANPLTDKPAYTSFETETGEGTGNVVLGGWTLNGSPLYDTGAAITGRRALILASGVSLSAPLNTAKPYTLSFWATGSVTVSGGATQVKSTPTLHGFTYHEYSIAQGASSISVSGSGDLDELRLYPQDARMSTVTYDPLTGKTATCDESSRLTYYTYDSLGRLQFVKDESGNIVKAYEYNNVSPSKQNGCPGTYYNREISESFARSNCTVGTVSDTTPYVYTVPAGKYSSTVSPLFPDIEAQLDILTNGQAQANANSACIPVYYSHADTVSDSTQSCAEGYVGGAVKYIVPDSVYTSTISQADADSQAVEEADANAQAYANDSTMGTRSCTFSTAPDWEWEEADSSDTYCATVNGVGHLFLLATDENPNSATYNQQEYKDGGPSDECPACVPSFTFSSAITSSQMNDISIQDSMVSFTWVFSYPSGEENNFLLGHVTSPCCYPTSSRTVPFLENGTTYDLVIDSDGQVYLEIISGPVPAAGSTVGFSGSYDINMNAYYSDQESDYFTRNNCPTGQTGSTVLYTVAQYRYQSYISQQDADQKAINDVNTNGQNYANEAGTCSVPCSFTPASGLSFYTSTVSESGSTASFDFVFQDPGNNYSGGTIGTITGGCVPSTTQVITVTDDTGNGDQWQVEIFNNGLTRITLESGTPPGTDGPPIELKGTYSL